MSIECFVRWEAETRTLIAGFWGLVWVIDCYHWVAVLTERHSDWNDSNARPGSAACHGVNYGSRWLFPFGKSVTCPRQIRASLLGTLATVSLTLMQLFENVDVASFKLNCFNQLCPGTFPIPSIWSGWNCPRLSSANTETCDNVTEGSTFLAKIVIRRNPSLLKSSELKGEKGCAMKVTESSASATLDPGSVVISGRSQPMKLAVWSPDKSLKVVVTGANTKSVLGSGVTV